MKRLLSISTLYPNAHSPRFGTFVARSLEALAARGDWQVTLINPIGVPPLVLGKYSALAEAAQDEEARGVQILRPTFPIVPKFGARFNAGTIARTIMPIAKRLHKDAAVDLVDAQFFYPDGPAAAEIARELNLPLSLKARGSDITYWGQKSYARRAMVAASDIATGILAVSEALRRDMADMGMAHGKIAIHYTGLDQDLFRPLQHTRIRKELSQKFGLSLPQTGDLICSIGALIARKGQRYIIEALPNFPDLTLLLVGRGEDEGMLRRLAHSLGVGDRVHFLGSLDHHVLPVVLSACRAMVLATANEGLANAWVEALACGVPVVTTDVGGVREIITSDDAGFIVPRTANGISAGIAKILAKPHDPVAVSAFAKRFSWAAHGDALADYYTQLITRP